MANEQVIKRDSVNLVAPRLTELTVGKVQRHDDGARVRVGGGLLVRLPARVCAVTGNKAEPYRIPEKGSQA